MCGLQGKIHFYGRRYELLAGPALWRVCACASVRDQWNTTWGVWGQSISSSGCWWHGVSLSYGLMTLKSSLTSSWHQVLIGWLRGGWWIDEWQTHGCAAEDGTNLINIWDLCDGWCSTCTPRWEAGLSVTYDDRCVQQDLPSVCNWWDTWWLHPNSKRTQVTPQQLWLHQCSASLYVMKSEDWEANSWTPLHHHLHAATRGWTSPHIHLKQPEVM